MEWLTGFLALLATLGTVGGVAVDQILAGQVRAQIQGAERLEVRVQSIPNYRLALGEIDRVRLAGRGLLIRPGYRVALVELETDPIKLDLNNLTNFSSPLKAAVHLQLTEADLNVALNTPEILQSLRGIRGELPSLLGGVGQEVTFDFSKPKLRFLNQELEISAVLAIVNKTKPGEEVSVTIRTGLAVEKGTTLKFQNPRFFLDDAAVPEDLGQAFIGSINEILELDTLKKQGITARILQLNLTPGELDLVGFAQIDRLPGS